MAQTRTKNKAAAALSNLRWSKVTKAERAAHGRMLVEARAKKAAARKAADAGR